MKKPVVVVQDAEVLAEAGKRSIDVLALGGRILCIADPETSIEVAASLAMSVYLRDVSTKGADAKVYSAIVAGRHEQGFVVAVLDLLPWIGYQIMTALDKGDSGIIASTAVNEMALAVWSEVTFQQVEEFQGWMGLAAGIKGGEAKAMSPGWLKPYIEFAEHVRFTGKLVGHPASILYTLGRNPVAGIKALEMLVDHLMKQQGDEKEDGGFDVTKGLKA